MTEKPIELDQHRGLSAQRATVSRRLISGVVADQSKLRHHRAAEEDQLLALPATTWEEAASKAKYLLSRYAEAAAAGDALTGRLVAAVLEDFERLSSLGAKKE